MKVALISCVTIRYMPYIEIYKKILKDLNIEYIIINEHEKEAITADNHYTYKVGVQPSIPGKIHKFFGWRKFVKNVLKKENVDKVVLLTTWPAVKMIDFWTIRFRNHYILDIRDFSNEDNIIYRTFVNYLVRKSYVTIISSEKFKVWLAESPKLQVIHNIPAEYVKKERITLCSKRPCVIGYVGLLNYEKQNRALVDACKDSDRITFVYKGAIDKKCHLKEYCEQMGHTNVVFTGKYNNSDKPALYEDVDMINAVYGNDNLVVTTALPNKLYDCILYKKPLIASKGTYLGELVEEYGVGFSVDTDTDSLMELINNYIADFDEKDFMVGCEKLLKRVEIEQRNTIVKIRTFFQPIK